MVTSTAESTAPLEVIQHPDTLRLVPSSPDVSCVRVEWVIADAELQDALYGMYADAFTPFAERAAMCHLLTEDAFGALLANPRVMKIVAWDNTGAPIGLTTLTTDLSTEQIAAEFYTRRYPAAHAAGELYYIGFLLVRADAQRSGVLPRLLRALVEQVSTDGGVIAFDVCGYNDETMQYAKMASALAAQIRPSTLEQIDVQTYYAVSFPATG
jgi:hypothetical protein